VNNIEYRLADASRVLDGLELAEDKRLSVVAEVDGLAALPMIRDRIGHWRRAKPGDGVAEALLARLAAVDGSTMVGRFTLRSWVHRTAAGERPMGVDQTNESVIVGAAAVVKWATHLQEGPHPAAARIAVLQAAGFDGMPAPWGLVTWQPTDGAETLVASVDEYLPGAVDGWTWAVDVITAAARAKAPAPAVAAAVDVGVLIADMHAGLSATSTVASEQDAARWREDGRAAMETACALDDFASVVTARTHRAELERMLDGLGELAGTPVLAGHGDLHVGQVLRTAGRFVVTDFDGNPVVPATQRVLPIPAALDVAGMTQSLAHAAIVARKYTALDPTALADIDAACRSALLRAYRTRLAELGHSTLFDPGPLRAFRTQQVLREIIYAARHLPRWMYVPDAALPALLDEGMQT
jgi:maltokinase